jgi:hypothetical protein
MYQDRTFVFIHHWKKNGDRLLCCEPYEAEAAFLPTHMATPYADFVRRFGFPMMRARAGV